MAATGPQGEVTATEPGRSTRSWHLSPDLQVTRLPGTFGRVHKTFVERYPGGVGPGGAAS